MSLNLTDQRILVTGGAGYIGSHTSLELLANGAKVTIVDNLINSSADAVNRIRELCSTPENLEFSKVDLNDKSALEEVFSKAKRPDGPPFDAVIHFAGLKSVGESSQMPLKYYKYNVSGAINLFETMQRHKCFRLVFSSSATVYGVPESNPVNESAPLRTTNPYGQTKLMIEEICRDLANSTSNEKWQIVLLRYFNPIGAHPSGRIGEDPTDIPNNLLPFVTQVAIGRRALVRIFGNDYDTRDGTGIRDYIHVEDLAEGHLAALKRFNSNSESGSKAAFCNAYNLGTGSGVSVLEMIKIVENVSGKRIKYEIVERRKGDVATCFADPSKAERELGWKTKRSLHDAVASSWKWQSMNPNGFMQS